MYTISAQIAFYLIVILFVVVDEEKQHRYLFSKIFLKFLLFSLHLLSTKQRTVSPQLFHFSNELISYLTYFSYIIFHKHIQSLHSLIQFTFMNQLYWSVLSINLVDSISCTHFYLMLLIHVLSELFQKISVLFSLVKPNIR